MSQAIFTDPIVTASPVRTGVGTGTLTVDRLTHFTITQTYTATCIAKSPDTLFAIVGSKDGPIGIAVVGTQYFDDDLKVFLTIQQGSTQFEIGDQFVFSVGNGTDLDQDNLDTYDELPQKNFGAGIKGQAKGDHNLRYLSPAVEAYLFYREFSFKAVTPGAGGNSLQAQFLDTVPAVKAALTKQDLAFLAKIAGAAGNAITVEYLQYTPATHARADIQDIQYQSVASSTAANGISVEYIGGGTAGSEGVAVIGNKIQVTIQNGVSTATQVKAAVDGFAPAAALVTTSIRGVASNPQVIQSETFLTGGANAIGDAGNEVVNVSGNAIQVTLESGVSTASQVKTKLDASSAAMALVDVSLTGTGSEPQTAADAAQNLSGGADIIGPLGSEVVQVVGNLIKFYFATGKSTVQSLLDAFNASSAALALATLTLTGEATNYVYAPVGPLSFVGGKNQFFSFNHHELTDAANFSEGNASVKLKDAKVQGKLEVTDHSNFSEAVTLDDQNSGNDSGLKIGNAQKTINELIEAQKITLRTSDASKLSWAKPHLNFSGDIIIAFNDTGIENTILASGSPVTINDGESMYVILNRKETATLSYLVAATIPKAINAYRIATRHGDHLILADGTLIRDGKSARIGEGGDGGGIQKISFIDPVSTTLPSGAFVTIDGVLGQNKDIVLYTNLSSGNNQAYELNGVGTSITWTALPMFTNGLAADIGDLVIAQKGEGFKNQIAEFNGTTWTVNDVVRYFSGADYWEMSSLKSTAIADATTAGEIFSINYVGSENIIVEFSIVRGTAKDTGTLYITTDGTTVTVTQSGGYLRSTDVSFSGVIVGGSLKLLYDSSASGVSGIMKFFLRRWSDSPGGPAGPISYTGAAMATPAAAGSNGQIQYNSLGSLGADAQFSWDSVNKILTLNGLQITGLMGPLILLDGQSSPHDLFSYDATLFKFAIVEFSVIRDSECTVGSMLITTNGSVVSIVPISDSTDTSGITYSAALVGGSVVVRYQTTINGFNGSFKYSMRRWA